MGSWLAEPAGCSSGIPEADKAGMVQNDGSQERTDPSSGSQDQLVRSLRNQERLVLSSHSLEQLVQSERNLGHLDPRMAANLESEGSDNQGCSLAAAVAGEAD